MPDLTAGTRFSLSSHPEQTVSIISMNAQPTAVLMFRRERRRCRSLFHVVALATILY